MREITFLNRESPLVAEELSRWRDRGEVGRIAARYLESRLEGRELAARSFELYSGVFDLFSQWSKRQEEGEMEYLALPEALAESCVAGFLSNLARSPFRQRLAQRVLRHFAKRTGQATPPSLDEPLSAETESADPSADSASEEAVGHVAASRIPTSVEIAKIDEEVAHILRYTAANRGTHTADAYTIMRAAAVAFCRYGGAVVADIVSMTIEDVQTASVPVDASISHENALGAFWRALRPRRVAGQSGMGRFASLEIYYEPLGRAPIAAWLAERLDEGASSDDPLFVTPGTKKPLTRRLVWALVAGHSLKEQTRMDEPVRTSRSERPPTKDRNDPPLLSPSRLRHAQGVGLVRRFGSGKELNVALRSRMGVSQRGLASSYRREIFWVNPSISEHPVAD